MKQKSTDQTDVEIAVKKTFPKILALLTVMNDRAEQYGAIEPVQAEFNMHIPKELMTFVYDVNSSIVEGILPNQEDMVEVIEERFDKYLHSLGPASFEVAEAAADPSLERVDRLVQEITPILARYVGVNPFPVLKTQMPFNVLSPHTNLSADALLEKRVANVTHILAKEGKTIGDVSSMSLDDIMRVRQQVQTMGKTEKERKFYEKQIGEKYAKYLIGLSQQVTPEKLATPELDQLSILLQDNLPENIPSNKRGEVIEELRKGGLADIVSLQSRMMILKCAEQFMSCAIDMEYIHLVKYLVQIGGVKVRMDGKTISVSASDYVAMGRKDMEGVQKLKDYLIDIAMEKGIEQAVTPETINEGIRFVYNGDKTAYLAYQRLKQRVENVIIQSFVQGRKITLKERDTSPVYQQVCALIDKNSETIAQQVFGK